MMTPKQYEAHCAFIAERDRIITRESKLPPTHKTIRKTWHGCDIPEGTPLIASAELQALFDGRGDVREACERIDSDARWFIIANGFEHICHLWIADFQPIN